MTDSDRKEFKTWCLGRISKVNYDAPPFTLPSDRELLLEILWRLERMEKVVFTPPKMAIEPNVNLDWSKSGFEDWPKDQNI